MREETWEDRPRGRCMVCIVENVFDHKELIIIINSNALK